MRDTFTCHRCGATLAEVRPREVLRVRPGVGMTLNLGHKRITFRCGCGHIQTKAMPRPVEMVIMGMTEQEAA